MFGVLLGCKWVDFGVGGFWGWIFGWLWVGWFGFDLIWVGFGEVWGGLGFWACILEFGLVDGVGII